MYSNNVHWDTDRPYACVLLLLFPHPSPSPVFRFVKILRNFEHRLTVTFRTGRRRCNGTSSNRRHGFHWVSLVVKLKFVLFFFFFIRVFAKKNYENTFFFNSFCGSGVTSNIVRNDFLCSIFDSERVFFFFNHLLKSRVPTANLFVPFSSLVREVIIIYSFLCDFPCSLRNNRDYWRKNGFNFVLVVAIPLKTPVELLDIFTERSYRALCRRCRNNRKTLGIMRRLPRFKCTYSNNLLFSPGTGWTSRFYAIWEPPYYPKSSRLPDRPPARTVTPPTVRGLK